MKNLINFLIIIGVTLSSFTTLRIGFIGPSELILFIAGLLIIIYYKGLFMIRNDIYIWFWISFLLFICISTIISIYCNGNFKINMISEIIAYIFTFSLIILYYTHFLRLSAKEIKKIMYIYYMFNSIIFIPLFIYSKIFNSLISFQLYYGDRLSLLSDNPHQLSLYMGVIVLLGLSFITKPLISVKNIIIIFNSVILTDIGLSTLSTTFKVSLTVSVIIILLTTVLNAISNRKSKYNFTIIILLISLIYILYIIIFDFEIVYNIFANDENGLGRLWLWSEAISYSINNTFMGYGLGTVIQVESSVIDTSEAHNILLDILLKAGIIPTIIFIILILNTIFKMKSNSIYLGLVLFIFMYSMAGFTLKRVIIWFVIIVLGVLISKTQNSGLNKLSTEELYENNPNSCNRYDTY